MHLDGPIQPIHPIQTILWPNRIRTNLSSSVIRGEMFLFLIVFLNSMFTLVKMHFFLKNNLSF